MIQAAVTAVRLSVAAATHRSASVDALADRGAVERSTPILKHHCLRAYENYAKNVKLRYRQM